LIGKCLHANSTETFGHQWFTIISSAKRHRLNTWAYLHDVLWRLADLKPGDLEQLLPDRWRDSHAPAV